MKTHVTMRREGEVGRITFEVDPRGKPPTLDYEVLAELEEIIRDIEESSEGYCALLITSASEKYFSVGANLDVLCSLDKESIMQWVRRGHHVLNALEDLPLPIIALVAGYALGGGLELALACDLIVANESSKFGQTEAALGFVPGWGGSYRLPRRVGITKARELMYTGRIIDAHEAVRIGIANFAGMGEETDRYVESVLADIHKNSRIAISMYKRLVHNSLINNRDLHCDEEALASSVCLSQGDTQRRLEEFFASRRER